METHHQIWYDITHFPRARPGSPTPSLDVVTRKWLATLVATAEETATQVEVVFTDALDTEGLWPRTSRPRQARPRP